MPKNPRDKVSVYMSAKKKLLLFGGNRLNEDGPLLRIAINAKKKGLEVLVFTEAFHLPLTNEEGSTFKERLAQEGIRYIECSKLMKEILKPHVDADTYGLMLNAIWLVKQDIIDLFEGRLFNYHNTNLPKERGAAAYSWKVLSESRSGGIVIHKVEEGLDQGDIVLHRSFTFPADCKIPADYHAFIATKEPALFQDFLKLVEGGKMGAAIIQIEAHSLYWPRLYTKVHGFINWSWSYKHIEKFINAFDDPYDGAMTFMSGKKIHLKKCAVSADEGIFHPFQAGLIFKKVDGKIYVAAEGGTLIIGKAVDENKVDAMPELKVGYRLVTPQEHLEAALQTRVMQAAEKIQLKKNGVEVHS